VKHRGNQKGKREGKKQAHYLFQKKKPCKRETIQGKLLGGKKEKLRGSGKREMGNTSVFAQKGRMRGVTLGKNELAGDTRKVFPC